MKSLYQQFYNRIPVTKERYPDELYLLTDVERSEVWRLQKKAMIIASFIGALGVILLYLPFYLWPHLFPEYPFTILGKTFKVPLLFSIYGGILALIEVFLLTLLNIYFIHNTGVATGFLHKDNKQHIATQRLIFDLANSKTTKTPAIYGINPFLGLSRQRIWVIILLQKGKGILSNALVKALAGRMGGRFALQMVQNLLGIPVYAFWDAWATRSVLRKTRAVIMGQHLIHHLLKQLPDPGETSPEFKTLLYDSLQYIATSKRYYHDNHNLLTERLFNYYHLAAHLHSESQKDFIRRLKAASVKDSRICAHIILTGCLLDERLSAHEEFYLFNLHKAGIIPYSAKDVWIAHKRFMKGESVMDFILFPEIQPVTNPQVAIMRSE